MCQNKVEKAILQEPQATSLSQKLVSKNTRKRACGFLSFERRQLFTIISVRFVGDVSESDNKQQTAVLASDRFTVLWSLKSNRLAHKANGTYIGPSGAI